MDLTSLNLIEKFIVEHGSAAVMGVHINLLREQLAAVGRETTDLKTEIAHLKQTNKELTAQVQNYAAQIHALKPADKVENMGVFWKRTPDGYEKIPYCGECSHHPIMTPMWQARVYACSNGHHAPLYVEPPAA